MVRARASLATARCAVLVSTAVRFWGRALASLAMAATSVVVEEGAMQLDVLQQHDQLRERRAAHVDSRRPHQREAAAL